MATFFKKQSASASMPSSTGFAPLYNIPVPAFLAPSNGSARWIYTTAAIVVALLVLEQSVYRMKKRHLPGARWTIPLIGKFLDSMHPSIENYKAQWKSGDLSAVSVFNMYVCARFVHSTFTERHDSFIVMAASNDYARKILNSPAHAEPCLVQSAKQILFPDNWCDAFISSVKPNLILKRARVFLTGKGHVEYRRGLNTLFTRKALG